MRQPPLPLIAGMTILLLAGCAASPKTEAAPVDVEEFILSEPSILDIQSAYEAGTLTAAELTQGYLDRIADVDPVLRSVIAVNPDAVAAAEQLDAHRDESAGPLYGIPILVKDNVDTADMPTTAGALALAGAVPEEDAEVVAQLREAGAIIIGKANLHEFAFGISTLSSLGGQTLNPYDFSRNPAGSSGGSAAAIAANLAVAAIGTDTGGSLRLPASATNTVGFRTSTGLISRAGVAPISTSRDITGPITRSVEDAAVLMDVLVGDRDSADPLSIDTADVRPESYIASLDAGALDGARIGVVRSMFGTTPAAADVSAVMDSALAELEMSGAELVEIAELGLGDAPIDPVGFEVVDGLDAWFKQFGEDAPVHSVRELLATEGEMDSGVQAILQSIMDAGRSTSDPEYQDVYLPGTRQYQDALRALLAEHDLDALVYPTSQEPPVELAEQNWAASNADLSASTGFPAISVPAGFTADGLPVGLELLGDQFAEASLMSLAYAYTQAHHHRKAPDIG